MASLHRGRISPGQLAGEQCAFPSASLAALSVLPFSLGTTQTVWKVAVAVWSVLIERVQVPVPEQAPTSRRRTIPLPAWP